MKRKRLTGWKRMAAFAMALTLTVGDWTSAGAAGLPQTDVQTVTEAVIQEEDAMEAALATEQTETESETDSESAENDSGQTENSEASEIPETSEASETEKTVEETENVNDTEAVDDTEVMETETEEESEEEIEEEQLQHQRCSSKNQHKKSAKPRQRFYPAVASQCDRQSQRKRQHQCQHNRANQRK